MCARPTTRLQPGNTGVVMRFVMLGAALALAATGAVAQDYSVQFQETIRNMELSFAAEWNPRIAESRENKAKIETLFRREFEAATLAGQSTETCASGERSDLADKVLPEVSSFADQYDGYYNRNRGTTTRLKRPTSARRIRRHQSTISWAWSKSHVRLTMYATVFDAIREDEASARVLRQTECLMYRGAARGVVPDDATVRGLVEVEHLIEVHNQEYEVTGHFHPALDKIEGEGMGTALSLRPPSAFRDRFACLGQTPLAPNRALPRWNGQLQRTP